MEGEGCHQDFANLGDDRHASPPPTTTLYLSFGCKYSKEKSRREYFLRFRLLTL
jgi:hypothetical protein